MSGAIVVIVVEFPPPKDPVGVALRTMGSFVLGEGGVVQTDTSLCGLIAGQPWEMGTWIELRHPALPKTRRRQQISYVDSGQGFAIFRVNLRFEGDRFRVPTDVSDVAVQIAEQWIEARQPTAVYITGRRGSPTEAAMAFPRRLTELTWWTWIAGLPAAKSEDSVVTPLANGVVIKLSDVFQDGVRLPDTVLKTFGIGELPKVCLGL